MGITRRELLWGTGSLVAATGAGLAAGYLAGEPPGATPAAPTPRGGQLKRTVGPIRLDQNESPYGPSPQVIDAIHEAAAGALWRWPDGGARSVGAAIAEANAIGADQVVVGAGSTDIMRACASLFLGPGKHLLMAAPGFDPVADYARAVGAKVSGVPVNNLFQQDLPQMRHRITRATGLVYLSNPFNPTGTLLARDQLLDFVSELPSTVTVLVDEAYIEYASWPGGKNPSLIADVIKYPQLIVTRTFSKIQAMAGMRVGYGFASSSTAEKLRLCGTEHGLTTLGIRAAGAALADNGYVQSIVRKNDDARQDFLNQSIARMLQAVDSNANFVLLFIDDCLEVASHFAHHGIRVAANFPKLSQSIRVALGTPDQMREFWRVFDLKRTLRPF
jgi:histidinol-phosphate aminotransferase